MSGLKEEEMTVVQSSVWINAVEEAVVLMESVSVIKTSMEKTAVYMSFQLQNQPTSKFLLLLFLF